MPRTPSDLIVDYAELSAEKDEARRAEGLAGLLVELLGFEGMPVRRLDRPEHPTIAFRISDRHHVLESHWPAEPMVPRQDGSAGGAQRILLSMSGFTALEDQALLFDRSHVEALLGGLFTIVDLIDRAAEALALDGHAHTDLAAALAPSHSSPSPAVHWAHLESDPMPAHPHLAKGTILKAAFVGDWTGPLGLGLAADGGLLVVGDGGVFEIDRKRCRTAWRTRIPGEALLTNGTSLLIRHGEGIVRVEGGKLTPVCRVGPGRAVLVRGRKGEVWAFTADREFHRLGSTLTDGPPPYRVEFAAEVLACAWLGERRFHLAANGHDGVVDLAATTRVPPESWRPSEDHNPSHAVTLSSGRPLIAFVDSSRRRVAIKRLETGLQQGATIAEFDAFALHDMVAGPEVVTILADLRAHPDAPARPVVLELWPPPSRMRTGPALGDEAAVELDARGRREDYSLSPRTLASNRRTSVTEAQHKPSGTPVAFKKIRSDLMDAKSRARREIEAARLFGDHPNVMSVLDSSRAFDWFVMPLADHTAEAAHDQLSEPGNLHLLVTAICEALRVPHEEGWVHRDLKPANILHLEGRWVVADWGLVRRPRGRTSFQETHGGGGTYGWGAPEQFIDAHTVGPQADIYAIGRIIGWALSDHGPQANKPLLPPDGPWRKVAQIAAQENPAARPASVDELLALINRVLPVDTPALVPRPSSVPAPAEPPYVLHLPSPAWSPPEQSPAAPHPPNKGPHPVLAWPGRVLLWMAALAFGVMTIASIGVTFDQGWGSVGRTVAAIATFAVPFITVLGTIYLDLRRLQNQRRTRPSPPGEKMPP